jgi:hypothetical protein
MKMEPRYPEISDWSHEGRAQLVATHRAVFSEMLRCSLEHVAEPYGIELFLGKFGFDTLEDAVDWSLEAFKERTFDLKRIPNSWKLFTVPRFWLAQRTGLPGFRRIMAELESSRLSRQRTSDFPEDSREGWSEAPHSEEEEDQRRLRGRLIATLQLLRDRTCASLVLWWLRATDELRSGWFDPPVPPVAGEHLSKKERSLISHDALFRFQCLHRQLVREGACELTHQVVREWLFRPCADAPPYRREDADVVRSLPAGASPRARELWRLRREGVVSLVELLVERAGVLPGNGEVEALFEVKLLRQSVSKTTLTVFKLDEEAMPELSRRIDSLAKPRLVGDAS